MSRFESKGQQETGGRLLASIDHSLRYLHSPAAAAAYRRYPVVGLRVLRPSVVATS